LSNRLRRNIQESKIPQKTSKLQKDEDDC